MKEPSNKEISEAKEYIRRRLSAELSMEHYLDSVLLSAAKKIVSLSYSRNIPPSLFSFDYDPILSYEVDNIINSLIDLIYDEEMLLASATNKINQDELIPYINRDINEATYSDRLNLYINKFKSELQDYISQGLLLGYTLTQTVNLIARTFKDPYKSKDMEALPHKGFPSYKRLRVLVRHTIADAWMYADMELALKNGAIGFYSYRGSSYPCAECDSHAGRFHTFVESYPPYHPNCVCYAVPIYNK